VLRLQDIIRVQVELTTRCNSRCPFCMRNYRGSDYNSGYPVTELSLTQFQQIFDHQLLDQIRWQPPQGSFPHRMTQFHGVVFNGNLGDFCNARDGVEIVRWLVDQGIEVKINTNGGARTAQWWAQLAHPRVQIGFALDGLADTHGLHRQDVDWHRVIENARAYIQAGGRALWRFCPFDHNRHQEQQCRDLAASLGFEGFENIWDGRDRGPVYTRDGEFSHWIGNLGSSESADPPPLQALLDNHVTWYDRGTIKLDTDVADPDIRCIHKVNREIYIAADGTVYPCCYLGFYPRTMHHPGNDRVRELIQPNNALVQPLEQCLAWFDQVEQAWQAQSVAQGRPYACVKHCFRKPQI
jgi:MoaA/NifB/PqqE/SkfB family radical SAM enzyme